MSLDYSSPIPWTFLAVSSLFMLFKQYVSIIQLVEASNGLCKEILKRGGLLGRNLDNMWVV